MSTIREVITKHRTTKQKQKRECEQEFDWRQKKPPELCVGRHKFLYYMEGSGYSMLVGGYKQSGGKKALNQGPNASPSASPNKKWATP